MLYYKFNNKQHELKEKSMQRSATLMSEKVSFVDSIHCYYSKQSGTHGPMKKKPVYFTQESGGRKQPQPPKGNSYVSQCIILI